MITAKEVTKRGEQIKRTTEIAYVFKPSIKVKSETNTEGLKYGKTYNMKEFRVRTTCFVALDDGRELRANLFQLA